MLMPLNLVSWWYSNYHTETAAFLECAVVCPNAQDTPQWMFLTISSWSPPLATSFFAIEAESHMINQAILRKQVFSKLECRLCHNPSKVEEFALKTPGYELRPLPLTSTKSR